jgi:hypothetical protein
MKVAYRVDPRSVDWNKFRYMVFDVPTHPGQYQHRYTFLGMLSFFFFFLLFTIHFVC